MNQKPNNLFVNIKYYAKFLRAKNVNYAIRAVYYPDDQDKIYTQDEKKQAVEICSNQKKGYIALKRWKNYEEETRKKKQSLKEHRDYYRNMAFTILIREGREVPAELFQAILDSMDEQIDDFEYKHKVQDDFDETEWLYSMIDSALKKKDKKRVEIFKEFSSNWNSTLTSEQLEDRYKSWKKRREKENEKWIKKEELVKNM